MEHTSIGTQKLRRVGNSLVITIPKQAAEQLGLSDGDLVDIQLAPMELRPRIAPGGARVLRGRPAHHPAGTRLAEGPLDPAGKGATGRWARPGRMEQTVS